MKKKRAPRPSKGRNRSAADLAARAAHFGKRMEEKIIPRELTKVSPPLAQMTEIKKTPSRGDFVGYAEDGTPMYSQDERLNPFPTKPMVVFLPDMPERPTTPTPPAAEMEQPYPDPENRMAWARAKYLRMQAQTGGARPSWVNPGGVVSRNIEREAAANRPRGPFGPVGVTGPWPGGRK